MNNKPLSQHKATGFTIVELLVVISIIALLVGILVPAVQKARDSAKVTQSKSNIHQVMTAMVNRQADDNDRHFSPAPDNLSRMALGGTVQDAIDNYKGSDVLGIELGTTTGAQVAYLSKADGVAPFCFGADWGEGSTMSDSGDSAGGFAKPGYGAWRYPNAGQIAVYMNNAPLHPTFFAPKDTIPLAALENCDSTSSSYCASTAAQDRWGLTPFWTSNMLGAPSSYCISPAMMYDPAVYQWDMIQGKLPQQPMDLPRGFQPPSGSQAKYPAQKTWLMEHNWLQNVDNNDCGINWDNTWFMNSYGTWDGCEPEHFNAGRSSEPVTVMGDGSTITLQMARAERDSDFVESGDNYNNQGLGLYDHPGNGTVMGAGNARSGGYYAGYSTDWVHFVGHVFTMDGIRGRDILADR